MRWAPKKISIYSYCLLISLFRISLLIFNSAFSEQRRLRRSCHWASSTEAATTSDSFSSWQRSGALRVRPTAPTQAAGTRKYSQVNAGQNEDSVEKMTFFFFILRPSDSSCVQERRPVAWWVIFIITPNHMIWSLAAEMCPELWFVSNLSTDWKKVSVSNRSCVRARAKCFSHFGGQCFFFTPNHQKTDT